LSVDDLDELRTAVDRFTARLRMEPLRDFYSRSRSAADQPDSARDYFRTAIARMHAVQVLLFNIGQIDRAPAGRIDAGTWTDHLAPPQAPPTISAVIERYLRLHLAANLDRPQTVRHSRDALRRLVQWLTSTHPEITNFNQLHREHAEEFLRWFGEQTSQQTGIPSR